MTKPTVPESDHEFSTPLKALVKRKGKEHANLLKQHAAMMTKPNSKGIQIGKKSRNSRLNNFPLLAAFTNLGLDIEDLDKEELKALVFDHPLLPL